MLLLQSAAELLFTASIMTHGFNASHYRRDRDDQSASGVSVPQTRCPLSQAKLNELKRLINPLTPSSNYGVDIYDNVCDFITSSLHNPG